MATPTADKVIVTHKGALSAKYQPAGLKKIEAALAKLIAADAKRGVLTAVVDLSSKSEAKKEGFAAVPLAKVANAKLHKLAIDKIYAFHNRPAYLMLLGAPDVIPHVPLRNPLHSDGQADPDATVPSDLPYACDVTYGVDARKFIAPTRVLGRLPDVVGSIEEDYLVGLIETAAGYKDRPLADYDSYFGLSAKVWQESTAESLDKLFGAHTKLQLSPPVLFPTKAPGQLDSLLHFINCHGGENLAAFYGQKDDDSPTVAALDFSQLNGKIKEGTVASVECCYGAQLFDPDTVDGSLGICNTYLREKAYGFFGSSTIAYGPADGNELADLVCRFFLEHVREGASLGRACLQARLDYAQSLNGTITGTDLKTLAQFNLLGDPAITPVQADASPKTAKTVGIAKLATKGLTGAAAVAHSASRVDRFSRDDRRDWLRKYSGLLASAANCVGEARVDTALNAAAKGIRLPANTSADDRNVGERLRELTKEMKLESPTVLLFAMEGVDLGGAAKTTKSFMKGFAKTSGPSSTATAGQRVHVVMERTPIKGDTPAGSEAAEAGESVRIRGFEAVELDGMLKVRKFVSR